jgi:hypothetical protein
LIVSTGQGYWLDRFERHNLLAENANSQFITEGDWVMGKMDWLIMKIFLGIFAATNFVACIITTDAKVLVPLNILVAAICLCIFLFLESKFSGIAMDLGISKKDARKLVREYFDYYKNVERISIYEYFEKFLTEGGDK